MLGEEDWGVVRVPVHPKGRVEFGYRTFEFPLANVMVFALCTWVLSWGRSSYGSDYHWPYSVYYNTVQWFFSHISQFVRKLGDRIQGPWYDTSGEMGLRPLLRGPTLVAGKGIWMPFKTVLWSIDIHWEIGVMVFGHDCPLVLPGP